MTRLPIVRETRFRNPEAFEMMTLAQAATMLGTSPDNLRGAIARGSLRARKVGRDWLVDMTEVSRYRRENRRTVHLDGSPVFMATADQRAERE